MVYSARSFVACKAAPARQYGFTAPLPAAHVRGVARDMTPLLRHKDQHPAPLRGAAALRAAAVRSPERVRDVAALERLTTRQHPGHNTVWVPKIKKRLAKNGRLMK